MIERLLPRLYRFECPSAHTLGEYWLKLVPAAERQRIQHHLADCPHCQGELDNVRQFLNAEQPLPLIDQIRQVIARLVGDGQQLLGGLPGTLALEGIRGETGHFYQADDLEISLAVETEPQQPELRSLVGYLEYASTGKPPIGGIVRLASREYALPSQRVDDIGNFVISHITPGSYDLVLETGDVVATIPDLEIA